MSTIGPITRFVLVAVTWLAWVAALVELRKSRRKKAVRVDSRARWGLVLETAGYFIVCSHGPNVWTEGIALWRGIVGCAVAAASIGVFWNAVGALGSQWRFDAGLNEDHELVQDGAYRFVRHPIYASMFGMLVSLTFLIGTLPGWPVAVALFIIGTEIRIRVEDSLLRERFGERFLAWRRSTPAYLPFVR
ncbi:MAG TPA: isoprenylcysteine carboxylmethyltransferase family protein [Bryobacteraceae bacterium]|nr:isoprenylcysteine carboxylmethyltransferase family protein [Bryobacteraceae bacterium]